MRHDVKRGNSVWVNGPGNWKQRTEWSKYGLRQWCDSLLGERSKRSRQRKADHKPEPWLITVHESMESLKMDTRTEIKKEIRVVKEIKKDLLETKEMNKNMKTELESGFRNDGYERKKICDELVNMKEEMRSMKLDNSRGVRSAGITGFGLRSDAFARPREAWIPRKVDIKGWVEDWSQKETTGLKTIK